MRGENKMNKSEWSAAGKSRADRKNSKAAPKEAGGSEKEQFAAKSAKRAKSGGMSLLTLLLIVLLTGSIYLGFEYTDRLLALDKNTVLDSNPNQAGAELTKGDLLSVLIIGTDQRDREATRADTLILAVFDKKDREVHLFSLPRDTRAEIPGRRTEKLNHAYAYGGGELTKQTVEKLLDFQLDGFISTNFAGFANIVDIIGGIELEVERRMYYPDEGINLFPGLQKLSGADALAYVRFRSDALGDVGRMERQQKFLKVLAEHLLDVSHVLKIPSMVREFNSNVATDMSVREMVAIANLLRSVKIQNLSSQTLPGEPVWINRVNYWQLDQAKTKKLLDEILHGQPEEKEENT
jgi:LCP family protein required for cell wall assembly